MGMSENGTPSPQKHGENDAKSVDLGVGIRARWLPQRSYPRWGEAGLGQIVTAVCWVYHIFSYGTNYAFRNGDMNINKRWRRFGGLEHEFYVPQ